MNRVLYTLCRHNLNIMDGWLPFPSTAISRILDISLYKTRKELKKLKEQGLVESCIDSISDDEGTCVLRGYRITEKAKETEEYKKAFEEERKICKECFGIDIRE